MKRVWWLGILLSMALPLAAAEKGFVSLFDGKTLNGWQLVGGHGPGYLVKNGILVCPADGGGNLFTAREYANFIFRFEFKMQEGSNNGVGIRTPLKGDAAYVGMEIQLLDHDAPVYQGKLQPAQKHGSVYDVFAAKTGYLKKTGEWNQQEIMADGRRIRVTLNGTVILDANLDEVTDPEKLKKHPGLSRKSGYIGFLGHGTHVEFRNIRIRELPSS
jgi:hypothetical protein